jgi:hypothetical protein
MRRSQADLGVTAAVAVLACGAAEAGAPAAVTALLGIVLFAAPGYLLAQLLLGPRTAGLERLMVMAGLALAVPVLGGLLLDLAGVPLHREGWLGLLAGVCLAGDVALYLRRRGGRAEPFGWPSARWRPHPRQAVAFGAAVMVAGCGLGLARIGAAAQHYPGFTQLWLSARDGHAYTATLGVGNHQGAAARYRLVLLRNGSPSASWNLTLADGQTWHRTVTVTARYALAADLYRLPDLAHPYRHVAAFGDRASGL